LLAWLLACLLACAGKLKSPETLANLTKLVYVYDFDDRPNIGSYSTVDCAKFLKLGSP